MEGVNTSLYLCTLLCGGSGLGLFQASVRIDSRCERPFGDCLIYGSALAILLLLLSLFQLSVTLAYGISI